MKKACQAAQASALIASSLHPPPTDLSMSWISRVPHTTLQRPCSGCESPSKGPLPQQAGFSSCRVSRRQRLLPFPLSPLPGTGRMTQFMFEQTSIGCNVGAYEIWSFYHLAVLSHPPCKSPKSTESPDIHAVWEE